MTLFTTSSKRISENLKVLEQYCEDYNKLIRCVNTAVLDKKEEDITRKNIEELNAKFKSLSTSIKDKLKLHADDICNYKGDSMNYKLMKLHIKAHTRRLTELINRYRELQFIQKRNEEDRLQMLVRIANKDKNEGESKQHIEGSSSTVNIASQYALGKTSKKLCLEEAERRNTGLLKIKEMARELDDLCRLISETIFSKSMEIDTFADELIETEANMSKANIELETTLKRKIARKKFWRWVMFICFCILTAYLTYKCLKDDWFEFGRRQRYDD